MARPFTRAQRRENAAFLRVLARTGNAHEAARQVGAHRAKFTRRRGKHPAFAQQWEAALAVADAALAGRAPSAMGPPRIVIRHNGRCQVRRPLAGRLDAAAQQRFLRALSATCNIRLAAAAAGFSHSAFYRLRERNPAFAREMRAALVLAGSRIEFALLEGWRPGEAETTRWRDNAPPEIPPMNAAQALQLLTMHNKALHWREVELRHALLPGETRDARSDKFGRLYRAGLAEQAEDEITRRRLAAEPPGEHEPPPLILPDLAQVTGWSQADPAKLPHGDAALFGGWRIADMERQAAAAEAARRAEAARIEAESRAALERARDEAAARHEAAKTRRRRRGGDS